MTDNDVTRITAQINEALGGVAPAAGVEHRVLQRLHAQVSGQSRMGWRRWPFKATLGNMLASVAVLAVLGGSMGIGLVLRERSQTTKAPGSSAAPATLPLSYSGQMTSGASSEPPSHGVSAAAAVAAARAFFPEVKGSPVVVRSGPQSDFAYPPGSYSGHAYVWVVVFRGTFQGSGGPAPLPGRPTPTRPPPATTIAVFVDYSTGRALYSESPAAPQLLPGSG